MENTADRPANVFRNRNFRLTFLGALVSDLGALLYSFAVSFYILDITENNAFLQGLYLALCGAVHVLATPVGGVLGDRWNKAKIMFVCDYLKGGIILAATAGMLLLPTPRAHVVILFATGILGNAVSGVFSPAAGSLLPHIVEETQLQQANSYNSIKGSLQSILGVVLAGVLYAALPVTALFALVGACYLGSGVSEMFIRYDHKAPAERLSLRLALADLGDGLRYLRGQRAIMALMVSILFINFFFSPVASNFLPYFVKTDVAGTEGYLFSRLLTPELWSSVFSVLIGVSSLAAALVLSTRPQPDKCGRSVARRLAAMAGLMVLLTAGYWLLVDRAGTAAGLNAFLGLLCLGCLILGVTLVFINIPINTAIMRRVDKTRLSKVTSLISIISQGMIPIASVLAGSVLQAWGSSLLLLVCSLGFTAAAAFLLANRQVRDI